MIAALGIGIASWIAFVIVAIVVLALAGYLITVAWLLNKVTFKLGTILIGVRAIAHQTEPVGEVVTGIADDVAAMQQTLHSLLPGPSNGKAVGRLPRGRSRSRATGRA